MLATATVEAKDPSYGLKNDWKQVERTLAEVIPVYEKVNRFISLGTDIKIRTEGIRILLEALSKCKLEEMVLLDLGSGPGKMSELLMKVVNPRQIFLVEVDALEPMMRVSKSKVPSSEQVLGIYEQIPLRKNSLDGGMAGFAIRDSQKLTLALSQIAESLKDGGYFLIVDLSKPDSRIKRSVLAIYWRVISPFLATLASARLGRKFAALYTTFRRLPTRSEFSRLVREAGFDAVFEKYEMLGGSETILLRKSQLPRNSVA